MNFRFLLSMSFLFANAIFAQEKDVFKQYSNSKNQSNSIFLEKGFIGGTLSLNFFNSLYFDFSPVYGIKGNKFAIAAGPIYNYISVRNSGRVANFSTYGAKLLGRYYLNDMYFFQLEYQNIYSRIDPFQEQMISSSNLFIGGGINSNFSDRLSGFTTIQFYILESPYTPYISPFVQAGVWYKLKK